MPYADRACMGTGWLRSGARPWRGERLFHDDDRPAREVGDRGRASTRHAAYAPRAVHSRGREQRRDSRDVRFRSPCARSGRFDRLGVDPPEPPPLPPTPGGVRRARRRGPAGRPPLPRGTSPQRAPRGPPPQGVPRRLPCARLPYECSQLGHARFPDPARDPCALPARWIRGCPDHRLLDPVLAPDPARPAPPLPDGAPPRSHPHGGAGAGFFHAVLAVEARRSDRVVA